MKSKVVWLIVTGLVVTAVVLISCGPQATTTPPTTTPPTTTPPTTTPPTTTPPSGEPQYGGTLTILQFQAGTEPQTWDPYDYDYRVDIYTSPYMENLFMGDLEGKGPRGTNEYAFTDYEYVPPEFMKGNLAESWEVPDDKTIIYHLRQGIRFPDKPGVMAAREMTAEDVAFCMNRLLSQPKFDALSRPYYEGATAKDKYTVVLKLKSYWRNWVLPLGWGYYSKIYPQELVKAGITDWKNAVGTGPFKLKTYVSGASVTYERNPDYWGTTKIGGKEYKLPFVDRLEWPIIVDESTRLAALRTAKCDINEVVSWKFRESLEKTNPELLRYKQLSTTFAAIAMRTDKKPFSDIRVRQAISMAIDRKAYNDTQQGGEGEMLSAPFSMGWPKDLYTPMEELPQSARELFEYNPTKAKQLLTEAGYPSGFKAEMVIYNQYADQNSMLAAFLEAVGVQVTLKAYDYTTYVSIMYGNAHKDMYSILKGNGDPYAVFTIARTGSIWNPAVFNDKYFMDTLEKASTASSAAEAKKVLKALNVYVIDQCPYALLPVSYQYAYAWPWVKNWYGEMNVNARSMGQVHARVWLDRDLREKMIGRR